MPHGSGGTTLNVTTPDTTVTGTVAGETINALAAYDTIIGGPGYEYLKALAANDTLEGHAGSDTFTGDVGGATMLIALPDLSASLAGVEVDLSNGNLYTGLAITGNANLLSETWTHQHEYSSTISNINDVTVNTSGLAVLIGNDNIDILISAGTGPSYLQGSGTLIGGSGYNVFVPGNGTNTLTGGSGGNYYYQAWGIDNKLNHSVHNDIITNFNTSTDVLAFQLYTKGSEAPTSWNLVSVNGVPSLEATLGDGMSTLTLIGVTDPSLIHMENFNPSTGVTTQLPDVGLANATEASAGVGLVGVSDVHLMHNTA